MIHSQYPVEMLIDKPCKLANPDICQEGRALADLYIFYFRVDFRVARFLKHHALAVTNNKKKGKLCNYFRYFRISFRLYYLLLFTLQTKFFYD